MAAKADEQPLQVFRQRRIFARQRRPSAPAASNFLSGAGRRQISQPSFAKTRTRSLTPLPNRGFFNHGDATNRLGSPMESR